MSRESGKSVETGEYMLHIYPKTWLLATIENHWKSDIGN